MVGKYQHKPPLPFALGTEYAGVVHEIGNKAKTTLKVGDKVMGWQAQGAMSQYVAVNPEAVMALPRTYSFADGACFGVGYMTAYHGLIQRGNLKKGETLLVTGAAGGMGVAAIQLGVAQGATVIAAASSDEKLEICRKLGAHHTVNYSKYKGQEFKAKIEEITNGNFVDVVYEIVGGSVFDDCVKCMAGMGRLLVIGFAGGEIPKFPVNLALVKGFSVVGVRSGAQFLLTPHLRKKCIEDLLPMTEKGLKPHIDCTVPMDRAREAFTLVSERKVIGKAVILISHPNVEKAKL